MERHNPEIIHPKAAFNHFLDGILYRVSKEPRHVNIELPGPISHLPIIAIADERHISLNISPRRMAEMGLLQDRGLKMPELQANYFEGSVGFILQNFNSHISDKPIVPDFFPREFKKFVLNEYFASFGKDIQVCKSWWGKDSDNLRMFYQNLDNGMSKIEAAKNTWAGITFAENGFGNISRIRIKDYNDIEVIYKKS